MTNNLKIPTDYYPFDGHSLSCDSYRYGFNGKEKDHSGEWGTQTHYDYGFRIYNPAIGKFLSVDPLTNKFAQLTPYQFASNMPIVAIDLDGLETYTIHSSTASEYMYEAAMKGATEREILAMAAIFSVNGYKSKASAKWAVDKYGSDGANVVRVTPAPEGTDLIIVGYEQATKGPPITFTIFSRAGAKVFEEKPKVDPNYENYKGWIEFVKQNPDNEYGINGVREASIYFLQGDDVQPPPNSNSPVEDLKWPSGAFETNPWRTNRTNHVKDIATWEEFLDDYKKDPEKYLKASHDYIRKYYGEEFHNKILEKANEARNKATEKSMDN